MRRAINILLIVLIVALALSTGYNTRQLNELRTRTAFMAVNHDISVQQSIERDKVLLNRDNILYAKLVQFVQVLIDQGVLEVSEEDERAR